MIYCSLKTFLDQALVSSEISRVSTVSTTNLLAILRIRSPVLHISTQFAGGFGIGNVSDNAFVSFFNPLGNVKIRNLDIDGVVVLDTHVHVGAAKTT